MRTGTPETPLILWICAAVCAHFMFAEGGDQVAIIHDDTKFIAKMASDVRGKVKTVDQTIEIQTSEEGKPTEEEPPPAPKPEATVEKKPEPPKPEPPKQDQKKQEPPKQEVVKVEVKKDDPLKKLDQQELKPDSRIAVKQHVQPKQEDNPNARFIGDEANHVQEESVATQTAHDQDDPNPTPGTAKAGGPKDRTGDSDRTKIADSEEHKGEKNRAPGEKG
ncbi:MAG TPA: hypothetical protein VIF62_25005, partial [Labilithrix sp.]